MQRNSLPRWLIWTNVDSPLSLGQNVGYLLDDILKIIFYNDSLFSYFDLFSTRVCFYGINWQWVNIGSSNGLEPNRRQAIACVTADPVHWHIYIYTSLGERWVDIVEPSISGQRTLACWKQKRHRYRQQTMDKRNTFRVAWDVPRHQRLFKVRWKFLIAQPPNVEMWPKFLPG